jgi:hypothetical protein
MGQIPDQPSEPVAWVNTYGPRQARIFFTSLGHHGDFDEPSFRRLLDNALRWAIGARIPLTLDDFQRDWQTVCLPRAWERILMTDSVARYDGLGWYRRQVQVPAHWKGHPLQLRLGRIDDSDQAFFNGSAIGGTGSLSPGNGADQSGVQRSYTVSADQVRPGQSNTIAVRVMDRQGRGGIYDGPLSLGCTQGSIPLTGLWQFRVGDDPAWAQCRAACP